MSKRSYRRLAVVAGAALAVGSMAPAMAVRIDAGAGAEAEIDPAGLVTELTGALPVELPDVALPTVGELNGTVITLGGLGLAGVGMAGAQVNGLVDNVLDHVTLATAGLGGDCGLVAVASCNAEPAVSAAVPVNVLGLNVLRDGILNNGGDLGLGVLGPITADVAAPIIAPVAANVGNILDGGVLNGLGGLGLGGLLDVDASANVLANVLAVL